MIFCLAISVPLQMKLSALLRPAIMTPLLYWVAVNGARMEKPAQT